MTEFDDLRARLAALEGTDLPDTWSRLKRKLEQDWQPDANTLLAGGSIGIDDLSAALTFGIDAVVWGGASRLTAVLTVLHGLGRQPTNIQLSSSSSNTHLAWSNLTPTSFDVTGNTIDGTSPAAATTRDFSWEAK
jgi:hypothetical protein